MCVCVSTQAALVSWLLANCPSASSLRRFLPAGLKIDVEEENMCEEELAGVITDAFAALGAMQVREPLLFLFQPCSPHARCALQGTVNEVLDFRALESGINSLKLKPRPAQWHSPK